MLQFDFNEPSCGVAPCRFLLPVDIVTANRLEEVTRAVARVQEAVASGYYAAGFVAYEAAPAFDAAMAVPAASEMPLVWFGVYEHRLPANETDGPAYSHQAREWQQSITDDQFRAEIEAIRSSVAAGDVYQVNHTYRMRAPFRGDAFAWYCALRNAQQGAYSAYLDIGRFQILSVSPELFFCVQPAPSVPSIPINSHSLPSRRIITRPMKGTHRRGRWSAEDLEFCERLASSGKDRAENLMIVDLLRNDLGRIAETGSVRVEKLFSVERYPTLLQMTSTVSAQLRDDVGLPDILKALFPCGSVTGAPKIAAMKQISELEADPRQIYCGTIGYMEPSGRAVFNVAIRTALVDRETDVVQYGVGSGITWDSDPEMERAENHLKAAILTTARPTPDLFETVRLENGVLQRRERHISRLLQSAEYFDIPCDRRLLNATLDGVLAEGAIGARRVRLRVSAGGTVSVESERLSALGDGPMRFAICPEPVDRNDRFLYHKVADRSPYAKRKAARADVYDVLLLNREGELTEFTTGNLVVELEGERLTPPLDCGLLPGVLRQELLEAGEIAEGTLRAADLQRADHVWLINSLRGWVPMVQID